MWTGEPKKPVTWNIAERGQNVNSAGFFPDTLLQKYEKTKGGG
jgi:hypothetical protein